MKKKHLLKWFVTPNGGIVYSNVASAELPKTKQPGLATWTSRCLSEISLITTCVGKYDVGYSPFLYFYSRLSQTINSYLILRLWHIYPFIPCVTPKYCVCSFSAELSFNQEANGNILPAQIRFIPFNVENAVDCRANEISVLIKNGIAVREEAENNGFRQISFAFSDEMIDYQITCYNANLPEKLTDVISKLVLDLNTIGGKCEARFDDPPIVSYKNSYPWPCPCPTSGIAK